MATLWQTVATYLTKPVKPDEMLFGKRSMSGPLTWSQLSSMMGLGAMSDAGVAVSQDTATTISSVWCAVKNISGAVGVLPLILYRRTGENARERFDDHPLYRILHDRPNPDMSAFLFWSTIESHVLLWGNGYAEIQRDAAGRIMALHLITPDRVTIKYDDRRRLRYQVSNPHGVATILDPKDMVHVRGPSYDGIMGISVVGRARQSLGLTLGVEKFGSSLFGKGPQWPGVLKHPKTMRQESKNALRADLLGLKPGEWPMLEEGIEWVPIGMPADDAQFLETKKHQVTEIARWFNIPPHKLKDLDRATFSNIEEQNLDYLTDTIHPELTNIAQEVNFKLIAPSEYRIQYAEHLVNARLWTKTEERNRSYSLGIQWGWLNPDEVRAYENLNPIPNGAGENYLTPANMVPSDKIDAVIDAQIEPDEPAPAFSQNGAAPPRALIRAIVDDLKSEILRALPLPSPLQPTIDAERVREVVVEALAALPPAPLPLPMEIPPGLDAETVRGVVSEALAALPSPPPLPPMVDAETVRQIVDESLAAAVVSLRATPEVERPPMPDPPPEPEEPPAEPENNGASARHHADVVIAQRQIIAEVVRSMQLRERDKARVAAAKGPERFRAWIGEFYPTYADVFQAKLGPSIRLHLALVQSGADPEAATRTLVDAYVEDSKRQLHALLDAQPADVGDAVRDVFSRWAIERAHGIPDAVMREEMARHG